jgi:hypothetical protein
VARHGLRPLSLETLVGGSWAFTDNSMGGWGVLGAAAPAAAAAAAPAAAGGARLEVGVLMSTIKLRQAGARGPIRRRRGEGGTLTGSAQNSGRLQASDRDVQSNCGADLGILGQPCGIRVVCAARA